MPSHHQSHTRITHLPDDGTLSTEERIASIKKNSKRKILILPALYSEFETDAMQGILETLKGADYVNHIVLGLDCADKTQYRQVIKMTSGLPQDVHVLWNDGSNISEWRDNLVQEGLAPAEPGKGRNVWGMMGYALQLLKKHDTPLDQAIIAMHDCDIKTYDASLPANLFHAMCLRKEYDYAKGHYPRHDGQKLNGRVTRLFVPGAIKAFREELVANHEVRKYLDYLDSYLYPLAGEMAFSGKALSELEVPPDWSLEIEFLTQMFEREDFKVCDVSVAQKYDHKHQNVSPNDIHNGLSRMVKEITAALLRKNEEVGATANEDLINRVQNKFKIFSMRLVESFEAVSEFNGLQPNKKSETDNVSTFCERIQDGYTHFLETKNSFSRTPSWDQIQGQEPQALGQLERLVQEDYEENTHFPTPAVHLKVCTTNPLTIKQPV